jgi:signal transduction histidine kinase/ActR/RegA family two-component response regulator
MQENIRSAGKRHLGDMRAISRELTEEALYMRCQSYLSRVKEQLLMRTIFEIDSSKKEIKKIITDVKRQRDVVARRKEELEKRIDERSANLEKVNKELRQEIQERLLAEKEKQKVQQQLLQSQKMESIGRLAGGMAHDFNNLLTAILGYSRLVINKLEPDDPMVKDWNVILEVGEKGAKMIEQLYALSRRQTLKMRVVNLGRVVKNMTKILDRMVGKDLTIEHHCAKKLKTVKADVGRIEQILLNLAINARDAMPDGGRLIIEVENVQLDDRYARLHEGVKAGKYCLLSVTDTGVGMSPEMQGRIFEPFFTTKKKGKGTGLGLAIVHGIVKQHDGHISVYSERGKGTSFKIYFPVVGEKTAPGEKKGAEAMPRGSETVLVVDDEETIRELIVDTLQPLGYNILEAPGGKEALEICQKGQTTIDVLLTDVIMPGIDGRQLRDAFLKKCPATKVIFMSGYSSTIIAAHGLLDSEIDFIHKPFSPSDLADTLRTVLDRK